LNNVPNPRLLIIGPAFFSYTNAIKTELNNHGIFCTFFNQLHSDSVLSKLAYRLKLHAVFFKQINAHREKIYQEIKHQNITDVLFISPDIIDRSFLIEIKKYAKAHLYMWDGFKNKKSAESCLDLFHTKSSFDNFDCDKYGMLYIPLFAEDIYKSKGLKKTYDISFCGTVHSDRPTWIKNFDKFSIQKKLKVKFLLFYYSPILLLLRLTLNRFAFDLYGSISFTSFSKKEIAETFEMSRAVIDITHPNQIGMTSRTFEALRSGSKLITNNQNCSILPDEFKSRIFVLQGLDFCEDNLINFIKSDIIPLTHDQDYYLSLKRFTKQILEQIHD
jgi:hypothetical protein